MLVILINAENALKQSAIVFNANYMKKISFAINVFLKNINFHCITINVLIIVLNEINI